MIEMLVETMLEVKARTGYPVQQEVADYLKKFYPEESEEDKYFNDRWGLTHAKLNKEVRKVLLATSPSRELNQYFKDHGYDLLIVHHDLRHVGMDISTIVYHTSMDISDWGHNVYFVKKVGLQNVKQLHKVVYYGSLPKVMTLVELKVFLQKRGFNIEGQVWQSSEADDKISSVIYCSGMGGMLIGPNYIIDVSKIKADVYITGQLIIDPERTPSRFKYIIELGHTSSEKPLFRRIKVQLENRWENLQVDLAPRSVDRCPTGEVCREGKLLEDDIFKPYTEQEMDKIHGKRNIKYMGYWMSRREKNELARQLKLAFPTKSTDINLKKLQSLWAKDIVEWFAYNRGLKAVRYFKQY